MFKTEKWKESSYLAPNFFRPLANPHMLPVMYLYVIFPMLPPWEMSQKILCATKVTENRNSSCSEFVVQSCSVTKSCLTLRSPMDCSTPGLPVPHHLLEFAQVHIHWVGCHPTISSSVAPFSSCPQSFPVSESFPMSRSSHQVAKVLELQLQHQSFQWVFRVDLL